MQDMLANWNYGALIYVTLILIFTVMALRAAAWSNGASRFYFEKRWKPWILFCLCWTGLSFIVLGWGILTGANMNIYGASTAQTISDLESRVEAVEAACK